MKPKDKAADPSVLAESGRDPECKSELKLKLRTEQREFELFRNSEDDLAFDRYLDQQEQP